MTVGSIAMPGILFAADARSLRRSQPDPPPESIPSTKFVSTDVTGCVSKPTCSVRSSEEAEPLAGAICALAPVKGIAELSSQKEIIKRQIRNVNFTSFPKCADYPTPSIARGTARALFCGWVVLTPNVAPCFRRKK